MGLTGIFAPADMPHIRMTALCACLLLSVVLLAFPATQVAAQEIRTPAAALLATLQPSEEATTLLNRADQGAERQDWKMVIDCLQRMVELGGEHLLTRDEHVYESARRFAQRRLAQLPEEGQRAYRLLHDGEAAALLSQAVANHDPDGLRSVAAKYLATSVGPQAVLRRADWLMDEGRFAEAAAELEWLQTLNLADESTRPVLAMRHSICLTYLGQQRRAVQTLDDVATQRVTGDLADRITEVRTWIAAYHAPLPQRPADSWPLAGGNVSRSGRMPAVEPTFSPELIWQVRLESAASARDDAGMNQFVEQYGLLPVGTVVTDGRLLLVKDGARLVAVDQETFQPRWRSTDYTMETEGYNARPVPWGGVIVGPQQETSRTVTTEFLHAYQDGVGAGIAVVGGLALTVEWPEGPPMPARLGATVGAGGFRGLQGGAPVPNRVAAYRLATGELAWSTDTAGGQGEMAGVQFLSVPIPAGEMLAAPARIADDLYLLLLKPASGELLRHIYLCGVGGAPFDPLEPRDPVLAHGLMYLPTGCGLMLALDASDFSFVWASRYPRLEPQQPAGWLPGPPLPVAGGVLLAPQDADALMLFDRGTGQIRWSVPRGGSRYLLAVDERHIWLAGPEVVALSVENGEELWRRTVHRPCGRGVLAGSRLILPTVQGLQALDAASGDPSAIAAAPEGDPLGNLWSYDGALYSVAPVAFCKHPDITTGYHHTLAKHEASLADDSITLRLAALELCKHRPAEALALLEKLTPAFENQDPHRYAFGLHLQVAAMLELVAGGQVKGTQAMAMLEQARKLSRTPADALASALALGDYYHGEGRKLDAAAQYLSLLADAAADEMIEQEEGYERLARTLALRRFDSVVKELSPEERGGLLDHGRQVLTEALAQTDEPRLRRLAECEGLPELADRAALDLAAMMLRDYRFEPAEVLLRRVLTRSVPGPLRAEALARLAVIASQPAELQLPAQAANWLEQLRSEGADLPLPAALLNEPALDEAAPAAQPPDQATMTGAEIAAALAVRLDARRLAEHQAMLAPLDVSPCGTPAPAVDNAGARPVVFRGQRREPLCAKRVVLKDDTLEFLRVLNGKRLWPIQLRLLGDMVVEAEVRQEIVTRQQGGIAQMPPRTARSYTTTARAAVEGQTMVVTSSSGLHAVGLMTGRRLWSRPFSAPVTEHQLPAGSDAWLCVENGYVATVQAHNLLEVASLEAGDRILWSRRSPQRNWYWVRARGDIVVAMDAQLQQVDVFELRSGISRGTCTFQQTPEKVSVALFGDLICGPVSRNAVAAYSLDAPGVERWRVEMPTTLCQIFKPRPDLVAISDRVGRLRVLEAASGRELLSTRVACCANGVVDGSLIDGVLYVYGFHFRPWSDLDHDDEDVTPPQQAKPEGDPVTKHSWAIAALSFDQGGLLWEQGGLPTGTYLSAELLHSAKSALPVAMFLPPSPIGSVLPADVPADTRAVNRICLRLLDKASGRWLGGPALGDLPVEAGAALVSDVQIWPGMVEVVAGSATLRFPCTGPASAPASASAP